MTAGAKEYGTALYELALEEKASKDILDSLSALCDVLKQNPTYVKILQNPAVDKSERLKLLDESLRGKIHIHVLNFAKILCEKKALNIIFECMEIYRDIMYEQEGILPVKAVSAVELSSTQKEKLISKLEKTSGKSILLETQIDESVIGGVKLVYSGKELNGTSVAHLEAMRNSLTL